MPDDPDQRRVDARLWIKDRRWNATDNFGISVPGHLERYTAHIARTRWRCEPVSDLGLDHHKDRTNLCCFGEDVHQQRSGDVIGKVGDDASGLVAGHRCDIDGAGIIIDDPHHGVPMEGLGDQRCERPVNLDGGDPGPRVSKLPSERTQTRTDLDDVFASLNACEFDDATGRVRVDEEVLST